MNKNSTLNTLGLLCLLVSFIQIGFGQESGLNPEQLWDVYQSIKISPDQPDSLKHAELCDALEKLKKTWSNDFHVEKVGESVQGRVIHLVSLGTGPVRIFLWSQMHGDEPTATNALLDIYHFLLRNKQDPLVATILENTTILTLPMLNPDGAQRFQRRNAQGIDVNRDARDLQTPEGRLLKAIRDKYTPEFGFNLHNQSGRYTVGKTNKLAAVALMAPPYDDFGNDNPVRVRAKKVATVILQSLGPFAYGNVAKYDDAYMPRAFGDAMQAWGTSTVLIETGGWYKDDPEFMVKLNFVGIMSALYAIAFGDYEKANPTLYDALPENGRRLYDLLIRNATIFDGINPFTFETDIGVNFRITGDDLHPKIGYIADMGDLDGFAGKDTINADGTLILPGFIGLADVENRGSHEFIRQGFTTIIHPLPIDTYQKYLINQQGNSEINTSFLLDITEMEKPIAPQSIGKGMSAGALGVYHESDLSSELKNWIKWLNGVSVSAESSSRSTQQIEYSWENLIQLTSGAAKKFKFKHRGTIRNGQIADLILLKADAYRVNEQGIQINKITDILLGGYPVLDSSGKAKEKLGRFILH